jgi:ABC-type branched-subunit amino acid transport system permease subunit
MSVINGLPAHILFVHLIVVLAPLTAGLAIVCAVWPAARRRLVWLVLALALAVMVTTPLTTEAGEWLEHKVGESPAVETHAELGDTMLYFAIALLVAAALLVFLHVRESRRTVNTVVAVVIAAVVVLASVATTVQVYRIGDSGSRAAWGDMVSAN